MVPQATAISGELCDPRTWARHQFGLSLEMRGRLAQRAFWVTGGGTGFGRAVATSLALIGARVVLTGRRASKLEETAREATHTSDVSDRFALLPLDLTRSSDVEAGMDTLRREGITGLVHCAAIPQPRESAAPLLLTDSLCRVMATNLEAAWRAGRAAIAASAPASVVRCVFFSSEAAWHFTPGFGPYNVSKAALNSLAGSLAEETAALHPTCDVQINVLNPGEARSEMNRGSERSPYAAVPMTLALLAQAPGGPNGRFFHADGRHLEFASARPWPVALLPVPGDEPPRLITSTNGHNIVSYRGAFLGVPQSLGDLHLETGIELPPSVIRGCSREDVERQLMSGPAT
jgi:NAD(P)-dependent dehydrogenase (short-subunit alcohol dehydrogenase family)